MMIGKSTKGRRWSIPSSGAKFGPAVSYSTSNALCNSFGCQVVIARGTPMTSPRAGVPSLAMLGVQTAVRDGPLGPNIVKGGTRGEGVRERSRRREDSVPNGLRSSLAPEGREALGVSPELVRSCPHAHRPSCPLGGRGILHLVSGRVGGGRYGKYSSRCSASSRASIRSQRLPSSRKWWRPRV